MQRGASLAAALGQQLASVGASVQRVLEILQPGPLAVSQAGPMRPAVLVHSHLLETCFITTLNSLDALFHLQGRAGQWQHDRRVGAQQAIDRGVEAWKAVNRRESHRPYQAPAQP